MATKQCSTSCFPLSTRTQPLSPSQALILLASPQARRGVRVGSICLCEGRWCQAPRGLEGEESRLVWSGMVTDVSGLSSGTPNGAEAEGIRERDGGREVRGKGAEDGGRGKGSGLGTGLRFHCRCRKCAWQREMMLNRSLCGQAGSFFLL